MFLFDGLLYRVNGILRQQFKSVEGFVGRESAIGIEPQLHFLSREALTNALHQIKLLLKIDSTHLQFYTAETLFQFLFHATEHLLIRAHPHQSVDGNALFTMSKRCIEKHTFSIIPLTPHIQQRRLQSEEHRGIVTHGLIGYLARLLHLIAE